MRDAMVHRGPDDAGSWTDERGRCALGHRRLSIVDLSPAGHGPMPNEDGTVWVSFNGEIYNHAALRPELEQRGHRFASRTDTEVIVHLWEEEGIRCVERLDGMFSLAIFDGRTGELFLARDRLGKKPLYYAQPPGGFVFGSEIKALLEHPAITPDLDEEAFHHYLTFVCTPAPMTMFQGVRKLAPAERMLVKPDGTTVSDVYWSPMDGPATDELDAMSEKELQERVLELLRGSIARRMMSDVPFGVFLSGGIDSSTNVALMSEYSDRPINTFTVGFKDHAAMNEMNYARIAAETFKTNHHEVLIDENDMIGYLENMVHHQDEPLADWVCIPLYFVSKLAHDNGMKVVQVGEGSDEQFCGYAGYMAYLKMYHKYWAPFRKYLPQPAQRLAAGAANLLSGMHPRLPVYADIIDRAARSREHFWSGAMVFPALMKSQLVDLDGIAAMQNDGHANMAGLIDPEYLKLDSFN